MTYATVLLSSREREALFRASHHALRGDGFRGTLSEFPDYLCDELDDGGVWNPCMLRVFPRVDESYYDDAAFRIMMILRYGIDELPEFEHDLRMIRERLLYVRQRNDGPTKSVRKLPPFFARDGYYGPDWGEVRERAIERDNERCTECGMSRSEHQDEFGHDLHVHHIEPLREFGDYRDANDLANLKTLCFRCHAVVERGR